MGTQAIPMKPASTHPVRLRVAPIVAERNRLTVAFRLLLALPHLVLVGAPVVIALSWSTQRNGEIERTWGAGGALGAVAALCALIAWFAIVFTGSAPNGLLALERFYLRWRVRATSYVALLRDEYPPFGEGPYPAEVELPPPIEPRDRVGVAFRPILVIPHVIAVWALGIAWGVTTLIAWVAILFTGRYPRPLYEFALGAFRWTTRVEAYLLLLTDEYPPFTLE